MKMKLCSSVKQLGSAEATSPTVREIVWTSRRDSTSGDSREATGPCSKSVVVRSLEDGSGTDSICETVRQRSLCEEAKYSHPRAAVVPPKTTTEATKRVDRIHTEPG